MATPTRSVTAADECSMSDGRPRRRVRIDGPAALRSDTGAHGATNAAINYLAAALSQELETEAAQSIVRPAQSLDL